MHKVSYVYNEKITDFVFSEDHPMKPKRMRMTHSLIEDYQLTKYMRMFNGRSATPEEICEFHHPDYIAYLQNWVSPTYKPIVEQYATKPLQPRPGES